MSYLAILDDHGKLGIGVHEVVILDAFDPGYVKLGVKVRGSDGEFMRVQSYLKDRDGNRVGRSITVNGEMLWTGDISKKCVPERVCIRAERHEALNEIATSLATKAHQLRLRSREFSQKADALDQQAQAFANGETS